MHISKILAKISMVIVLMALSINSFANDIVVKEISIINDIGVNIEVPTDIYTLKTQVDMKLDIENLTLDLEGLKSNLTNYVNVELEVLPLTKETVRVKFELQKKRMVNKVKFKFISEHNHSLDNKLRKKLTIKKGQIFKSRDLKSDTQEIKNYFSDNGYPRAIIKSELAVDTNEDILIIYKINLGSPQLVIDKININGESSLKERKIKKILKSKESSFFSKRIFQIEVLKNDLKSIVKEYSAIGHIDVKVDYNYKIKDDEVIVNIDIIEGEQLEIKTIDITGNIVFSTQEIRESYKVKTPSYFSLKKQQDLIQGIRDLYGESGYINAVVKLEYDRQKSHAAISIREGKQQTILSTQVIGNTKSNKDKILSKLDFNNGEIVNTKKINNSILALYKTGMFSDVSIEYFPITEEMGKIEVKVIEASTQTIQFSLGSVYGSAGGGASITDSNLFGTGASLSLSTMISKEIKRLSIIYDNEDIFGSDISVNASINHDQEDNYHYENQVSSFKIMFEKKITKNIELGIGTRLEYLSLSSISQEHSEQIDLTNTKDVITGFIGSFAYEKEKENKKGLKTNSKISLYMLPSYSNQDFFLKSLATAQSTKDIHVNQNGGRHQISGRISLGYASQTTPFHQKFKGGGMGTIRGYEYGSVNDGDNIGSNSTIAANVTYSMPIYNNVLSGVLFLDAFAPGDERFNMGDFRVVGGIGLRATMDNGFVSESFEAGITIPILKQDADITKPFYFVIGDYDPAYDL